MNWVYREKLERTTVLLPYLFIGNDFGIVGLELGITYYLTSTGFLAREYYESDGSESKESDDIFFNRNDSYVFMNMNLRIFRKDTVHFKLRFGRERFNPIDSLLNTALVIPFKNSILELYLSYPTGFISYLPESNQRFGISYLISYTPYFIGLNISYLISNDRGGDGIEALKFADYTYYSIGFETGIKW